MTTPLPVDIAVLEHALSHVFADWVRDLALSVVQARSGEVVLALPVGERHVHAGGVMCGQSLMAAADTAMVLAVMSRLGKFVPMTTVQLQTTFLRPVPKDSAPLQVLATVLRLGRTLAFGEIKISTPDGTLAMHATTTYALL